jgi:hypothetical protein
MTASARRNALKKASIQQGNATETLSSPKAAREGGETAEGGGESESRKVTKSNEPDQKQSGKTAHEKRGGKPQKGGEIRQSRKNILRNGN